VGDWARLRPLLVLLQLVYLAAGAARPPYLPLRSLLFKSSSAKNGEHDHSRFNEVHQESQRQTSVILGLPL
jgi:hypothetical protein